MNDNTRELVAGNVQATPALTRRIRKAALVEQNGQDPRAALMIAAGYDPNEVRDLQSRVSDLTDEAGENYKRLTSLTAKAERCAIDLLEARKQLGEKDKSKQILQREQNVLSERLAAVKDDLQQSVNIRNLPHEIADNIQSVVQAIRGGGDPRSVHPDGQVVGQARVDPIGQDAHGVDPGRLGHGLEIHPLVGVEA